MTNESVSMADGQTQNHSADGTQKNLTPDGNSEKVEQTNEEKSDTVAFSTYDKAMASLRKKEERIKTLESEIQAERMQKLEAEGRKDELIEELKRQKQELVSNSKQKDENIARSNATAALKLAAKDHGCINTDAFIKLVGTDKVEVSNQDFSVNADQVSKLVEEKKKEFDFLFKQKSPTVNDVPPVSPSSTEAKTIASTRDPLGRSNMYKSILSRSK